MEEPDFNPFIDDEDDVEDSVVSSLPNYTERELDPSYAPKKHTLDQALIEEEMPPSSEYDFEAEIAKIEAEMATYKDIVDVEEPLEQTATTLPRPSISALPSLPKASAVDASQEISNDDFDLNLDDFDWGSEEEPSVSPSETILPTMSSESLNLDAEEDWGFIEEADESSPSTTSNTFDDFNPDDEEWSFDEESVTAPNAPASTLPEMEDETGFDDLLDLLPTFEDDEETAGSEEEFTLDLEDEDWGFEDPNGATLSPPSPSDEFVLDEDWGFIEETGSLTDSVGPSADEDEFTLEDEDFDDSDFVPPAQENEDDFVPPDDPFAMPPELEESDEDDDFVPPPAPGSGKTGLKAKLADLKRKLKEEMGGDSNDNEDDDEDDPNGDPSAPAGSGGAGGILKKIFFPYLFIVGFVVQGIGLILGLLSSLPLVGKIFSKAAGASKVIFVIASIIPLLLIIGGLYYHGNSKFVANYGSTTFPDGGSVKIEKAGYSQENNTATVTIQNNGDVIAEVTPTVTIQATKLSANPLALFYPKGLATCEGPITEIPIDTTLEVSVPCEAPGALKSKVSASVSWKP